MPTARRANGTFKPKCKIRACKAPGYCRGICRKHYERWLKWGDVNMVAKPGSPRFVPDELIAAGITDRQRNHWVNRGILGKVERDPSGRVIWTPATTQVALLVAGLVDAKLDLEVAGHVARMMVLENTRQVYVQPSIYIGWDLETEPAPL